VICREVRDVRVAMRSLVGYDPRDPWQVPMPFEGTPEPKPIKVAFTRNTFDFPLHPAVAQALDTARAALVGAGYEVREVEPPLLKEAAVTGARCLFGEAKALMDAMRSTAHTVVAIFDDTTATPAVRGHRVPSRRSPMKPPIRA
jgi:amidase